MKKDRQKTDPVYSETAYDDAFKTMQGECDDLVIPLINHMFNEHYDETAVIKRLRDEYHPDDPGGKKKKRVTDSTFEIICADVEKRYHLECESKRYDGSILIRIFEYDSQISMDRAQKSIDTVRLRFPQTGLLLLRSSSKVPKEARIEIELPNGRNMFYEVPIIMMSEYSIDDIFEKKLYMLIPFYAFNYERNLDEINRDEKKISGFLDMYTEIFDRLKQELDRGSLSTLSYSVIIKLTLSVAYKLTMKRKNVQKKVGDFMGGKVLDLPEIRLYHQGKDEGRAEGEAERKRLEDEIRSLREELERLRAAQAANA